MSDVTNTTPGSFQPSPTEPQGGLAGEQASFVSRPSPSQTVRRTGARENESEQESHFGDGRNADSAPLSEDDSVLVRGLENVQQTGDQLKTVIQQQADAATEAIRAKPLISAGLVLGAGVLFGMLLNRPRS